MLERYGEYFVSYKGTGTINFRTELLGRKNASVEFECIQLHDSRILIHIIFNTWIFRLGSPISSNDVISFDGTLEDGKTLKTKGGVAIYEVNTEEAGGRLQFVLFAESIHIFKKGYEVYLNPNKIRFFVTNLNFSGIDTTPQELSLEIANTSIIIGKRDDYNNLLRRLRTTKFTTVTSYIDVLDNKSSIEDLKKIVFSLCLLLSFAKGTEISMTSYEAYNDQTEVVSIEHDSIFTGSFSSMEIIDSREPSDLKEFIENVFNIFVENSQIYDLDHLISTIVQAKSDKNYPNISGLMVASAVDVVRAKWAEKTNHKYILEKSLFEKRRKELKKEINRVFEGINEKSQNDMILKIAELNRPPFKNVLTEMLASFGSNITEPEIDIFISSRNKLVHTGGFPTMTNIEIIYESLYKLIDFAERVAFALLNYRGYYLNRFKKTRVQYLPIVPPQSPSE